MYTPLSVKIALARCLMTVQKRRKYTDELKQDAVRLVIEQGYKVLEATRNLGSRRWKATGTTDSG
ncbi:transposase [Exilibacterium tricleocarpae]|uniref:Transposase n=1 Tax=Exilibacterium tricleocarpae TaxID=2591008 RepID=A0A545U457_9GAMM|nr:transposase [Exilibacterium tricleocarpae]